jgi:plastocyanin
MKHMFIGLAAFTAAAVTAGSAVAATPKLTASVSDPLNISLKIGSKKVSSLKAGKYTIVVTDTASDHNFHLTGPGVNKSTSVGAKVATKWVVRLKKGTYKYVCDPHASFMKGSFTVR